MQVHWYLIIALVQQNIYAKQHEALCIFLGSKLEQAAFSFFFRFDCCNFEIGVSELIFILRTMDNSCADICGVDCTFRKKMKIQNITTAHVKRCLFP